MTRLSDLSPEHQRQALAQGVKPDTPLGKLQALARGLSKHRVITDEQRGEVDSMIESARAERQGSGQSKYGNIRCVDAAGRKFDSRKEMADFEKLVLAYGLENVIRQVSFPLDDRPPIQRIRADFLVIRAITEDGWALIELLDSKGRATADWLRKAKAFKERTGLTIRTI